MKLRKSIAEVLCMIPVLTLAAYLVIKVKIKDGLKKCGVK
jgi:hypothetical protein